MNNSTQLKALIKKLAKEKGISAQIILQYYMMERLLEAIRHIGKPVKDALCFIHCNS